MKIAICDDEQIYVDNIKQHLNYFSVENNIEFEQYTFISSNDILKMDVKFDIAILDIEMDEADGLKIGEYLKNVNPHIILIYVTAHKKYLDDALNLNAVRFFEKPLDSQRFYRGLKDAIKRIDNSTVNLYLRNKIGAKRIAANDIIFVEIEGRKTKVATCKGEYYSNDHISYWHNHLTSSVFTIPHKSFIINLNYITSYTRNCIILNEQYEIPIAGNRKTAFHKTFLKYLEGK